MSSGWPGLDSLRSKVFGPLALAAGLVSALLLVVVLVLVRMRLEEAQRARAGLLAGALVHAANQGVDSAALQGIAAALSAGGAVRAAFVIDTERSRVLASIPARWAGAPISAVADEPLRAHLRAAAVLRRPHVYRASDGRWLDYSQPIELKRADGTRSTLPGGVLVRLDARDFAQQWLRTVLSFVCALLSALTGYILFGRWHIQRQVFSPLAQIAQHVAQPAGGWARPWPIETRDDELGELATSLRRALLRLDTTHAQLEHQKHALDQHSIVAVTDVRGRITYVNEKFCAISKFSREEVLGRDHRILNSGYHPKTFFTSLWRTLLRGEVWHGEIRNRAKDGSLYWVDTTLVPWKGPDGTPTQFIAIRTDITEFKRAQEALLAAKAAAESALEARTAFLANMSHELRTPMNAVIGLTSLLLDTPLHDKQRELLGIVRQSSEALLALLNDILDYSKVEANKLELDTSAFDVRALLDATVDLFGAEFASKQLDLVAHVADAVPTSLLGDGTRYRQILLNLVSNALRFTALGEVEVSIECGDCSEQHASLRLSVRDTGIGIPADKIAMLFRPFTQVDGSTTRRFGGSGLGLAISKAFAELMSGRLWVESQHGQGSTFYFECRFAKTPGAAAPAAPRQSLSGQRVLVIDDSAACQRFASRALQRCGARVTTVDTFARGVELLRSSEAWTLIVADVPTPAVEPQRIEAELRGRLGSTGLPLVALSAELAVRLHEGDQLVTAAKPLKQRALVAAAERALQLACDPSARPLPAHAAYDATWAERLPLRILVAEDNRVNQKVASMMLERLGYDVSIANDGQQAIEAVRVERFDLILMDVHMPEVDGMQAARAIVELTASRGCRPRIVALTASVMSEERAAALAAGMDDFLSKPLRAQELLRVITDCRERLSRDEIYQPRSVSR